VLRQEMNRPSPLCHPAIVSNHYYGHMRLAIVGPVYPYRGGIAHHTTQMAQKFSQNGVEVGVFSFQRQYPAFLYPGKSDRDQSAVTYPVEARFILDPLNPATWVKTGHEMARFKPDGVVIQWWVTFWAPAFAHLAGSLGHRGIPVIYVIHNVMPHETRFVDRFLARLALSRGKGFIVQSAREETRLRQFLPNGDIRVCPHPVYDLFNQGAMPKDQARRALGLPLDAPVALFFGIVRPYKGLRYLIEAIAKLHERGRDVHLLVAGEFWEDVRQYERQIRDLGLEEWVHVDNRYIPNEEVGKYFSAADMLVAPYVDGTQSGAIKVAMGFGLPVVATEIIAQDMPDGVKVVQAGDASALACQIEDCLNAGSSATYRPSTSTWKHLQDTISAMVSVP